VTIKEKDNDGNTALHLAVDNGHLHVSKRIVQFCLATGELKTY